uniref:Uncharacterized protein n=1 Tax=Romanomermis culicivorax TaxID=13658 RepID=A0A915JHJ6_ROMCU
MDAEGVKKKGEEQTARTAIHTMVKTPQELLAGLAEEEKEIQVLALTWDAEVSQLPQGLWGCYQRHSTSLNGTKWSTVEEGTQGPQGTLVEPGESQADPESSICQMLK